MNGFDYLVSQGARADVLIACIGIGGITLVLAIVTGIRRAKSKAAPRPDADFCTNDDFPVPDSLRDSHDKEGGE